MDFSSLPPVLALLAKGWLFAAAIMFLLWAVQLRSKNATAVDVAWAANLGLLAVGYALLAESGSVERRWLVAAMVAAWSLRLSLHLAVHRLGSREEDGRYRELRRSWGSSAARNFFFFYQAQAALDVLLSIPFALAVLDPRRELGWTDLAGAGLWLVAILGESTADRQLAAFKRDPGNRGRTCQAGLWRFSRHPNYFFEWLAWCAFALVAIRAPFGAFGLIAPLLVLFLILKVTGIPPTEAQSLRSRGDEYRAYQRTTSAFVPWFRKKESAACGTNP